MFALALRRFLVAVAVLASGSSTVMGDVLLLRGGGKVEGQVSIQQDADNHVTAYVVQLAAGGQLTLNASQVIRHVEPDAAEKNYADLLTSLPDSAESHWKMVEFCRGKGLIEQKNFHLDRVLQLDPNHANARQARGFTWKDGEWVRRTDLMQRRGYVLHKGSWRLPQEIERIEAQAAAELAQKSWRAEMRKWRDWIGKKREKEALRNFRAVRDRLATMGLIELLQNENDASLRELYVDVLAKIPGAPVTRTLADTAVLDDDEEVRARSIERLNDRNEQAEACQRIIPYLRHAKNSIINRAAVALQQLGHADAILPLIDALVTTHSRIVVPQGNMQTGFGTGPGGGGIGFSAGQSPRKISKEAENRNVLAALVTLTGQNLQYDEVAWRNWYKEQITPARFDLRRDL